MPLNLDFGSVGDGSFPPINEGLFKMIVEKAEIVETKTTKKPMLKLIYKYDDEHDMGARRVWEQAVVQENTMWKVQQILQGVTGELWEDDNMRLNENDLVGCRFVAYVTNEDYTTGETNPKTGEPVIKTKQVVKKYLPKDTEVDGIEGFRMM